MENGLSHRLSTGMVLKNRAGPPADPDGFGTRNGKVQEFLGKNGQSFRPGREARMVTGEQIGRGGDEAPLQRDIPVS